jgi:hypothetical protein
MLINEGKYDARVTKAVLTETTSDDPQPVIEITVELTGKDLKSPVELSKSYYLSDRPDEKNDNKPEWQVSLDRLRILGFEGDDITQLDSVVGFVGVAGVNSRTSKKGTAYSAVSWIDKANTFAAKPMEVSKAKNFAALMKARLQASSATPKPAPRASQPQQRLQQLQCMQPKAKPAEPDYNAPDESDVPF